MVSIQKKGQTIYGQVREIMRIGLIASHFVASTCWSPQKGSTYLNFNLNVIIGLRMYTTQDLYNWRCLPLESTAGSVSSA
jgi:hypothetical protein